jgi:hypothetical protein
MSLKPLFFKSFSFFILNFVFCCQAMAQLFPEGASIVQVNTAGSGCDQADVSVVLSPDLADLSLFFDNYVAEIGDGSANPSLLQLKKQCQIQVQLSIPDGWQMAFHGVDYRGFVTLSNQGLAYQRLSIIQEGAPIVSMNQANLSGPISQDFTMHDEVRPERITWSPCLGGLTNVTLVSEIGVSLNPRSSDRSLSQISLDSADTSFKQSLSVEWRQCRVGRPTPVRPIRPGPYQPPAQPGRPPGPVRPNPREPVKPGYPVTPTPREPIHPRAR